MLDSGTVQLLHVEDDDLCIMGLARAFKAAKIANPVSFAHDGIDALEMLRGTNGRGRLPRPYLILLDLNMPRMGGVEFLKELREDDDLKRSIVFIMTTSAAEEDKAAHDDESQHAEEEFFGFSDGAHAFPPLEFA